MAIVTYPLNGITYNAEDAETYLSTRVSGVYASENCFDLTITADRTVTIGPGLAWVRNTRFAGKSICNREVMELTIPMADSSRPRTDRIVLRYDKASNKSELAVKTGTPGSAAAAPDVTDTRLNEQVCGLMRDGVTGLPTAQIARQADALLDAIKAEYRGVKDGSGYVLTSNTIADSAIDSIVEG